MKRVRRYVGLGLLIVLLAALVGAPGVLALGSYKNTFTSKYSLAGSRLDTCDTCHTAGDTSGWNPYGLDLQSQLAAGATIDQALTNVELKDSDGDGFSNIEEITNRTFPGDGSDKPVLPVLATITVSPATASVEAGKNQVFSASTLNQFGNSISATITWSSSDPTVGTIDSTGLFKAVSAGTTTITAENGTVNGTATATVTAASTPDSVLATITVSPATATVETGKNQVFSATTLDNLGNPISATITWTSSDPAVGTIDSTGLFKAVSPGTTIITAENGTVNGTATATVTTASTPEPVLATITVSPATASVEAGKTQAFSASTLDDLGNPISATITWTSSDPSVGTIDSAGLFKAVSPGTATITAENGTVNGTATATVIAAQSPVTSAKVTFVVTDSSTGLPIEGATVSMNGTKIKTDGNGTALFPEITPGKHKFFSVHAKQYFPTIGSIDLSGDATIPVQLRKKHFREKYLKKIQRYLRNRMEEIRRIKK